MKSKMLEVDDIIMKCTAGSEAQRGEAATAFTKQAIANSQKRQIVLMDWDKYGGRVLGDVLLNGQSLRGMLIANGFAREYYGEAKTSWCQ